MNVFVCPCCREDKQLEETPLLETFVVGAPDPENHPGRAEIYLRWLDFQRTVHKVTRAEHRLCHTFQWACHTCLEDGKALAGDPDKQNFGMGGHIAALYDTPEVCQTCGTDFVFSAQEQRFWYEELGFHVDSHPNACLACRKERRADISRQERLGALLGLEGSLELEQLKEIQEIYAEMGRLEKAELFARRVANREREKS